jgi:hypothetical protein
LRCVDKGSNPEYDMTSPYVLRSLLKREFKNKEWADTFGMFADSCVNRPYKKIWSKLDWDTTEAKATWYNSDINSLRDVIQEGINSGPSVAWDVDAFFKKMEDRR